VRRHLNWRAPVKTILLAHWRAGIVLTNSQISPWSVSHIQTAVTAENDVVTIVRIDPDRVMIAMGDSSLQRPECFTAIS
jgi:hypothetical protein